MPRPIRHPRESVILEYSHSFSSGPQASSTPTQDPSNLTWVSDLSPIRTSASNKNTLIQEDTSPDPFGFREIRGIRPAFKALSSKPSPEDLEVSEKETSSDSLSSQESSSLESTDEDEPLKLLSKKKSTAVKQRDLKYEKSEDDELPKKRRYTRKHQNVTENIEEKEKYEKDINTHDFKKQAMSSKDIIEYFREVDKFELDVEDVPADYTSDN